MEAITFTLGGEHYAIESRFAFEVFRLNEFARLPSTREMLFGVTVWRGDLLTILDIRHALGLRTSALHDLTRVIVLGEDRPAFGMLADRVHEMRTIDDADITAPSDGSAGAERSSAARSNGSYGRYVRGITSDAIIVLDAPALLTVHA